MDTKRTAEIAQSLADVLASTPTQEGCYAIIIMLEALAFDFERQKPGAGKALLRSMHSALGTLYLTFDESYSKYGEEAPSGTSPPPTKDTLQ